MNLLITHHDQIVILGNVVLALSVVEINLGYDALGWKSVRVLKKIVRVGVFSVNFYLLFNKIV